MIESAPRAGPTRSYLKGGGLKVAVGNRAQLRLFCCAKETGEADEPESSDDCGDDCSRVWAWTNSSSFRRLPLLIPPRCQPLLKRRRPPNASASRARSHARSSDAIPFHPVATPKWATIGMESRQVSILSCPPPRIR